MTRAQIPVKLFATLLLFWLLLNGSVAPAVILAGLIVAAAIVVFFGDGLSFLSGHRLTPAALIATLGFVGYFLKELVKANLRMAALVLKPDLPVSPAIVRLETRLTDPVARLLLANAITLTPGTLSVEMKGSALYVHWVVADTINPQTATQEIVAGFEHYLEAMYD